MSRLLAATLLGLGLLPAVASAGDGYGEIAKGIGKAAQRVGVQKVQILPFMSVDGEATPEGRMIASRIMAQLIDQGKVLVVEGDLPPGIPDPYRAALGPKAKRNVRPEADAVITGTHMGSGGRKLHVDVQLLRVQDRVILYSTNRKVKNEWEGSLTMGELRPRPAARREAVQIAAQPVGLDPREKGMDEMELTKVAWEEAVDAEDCRGSSLEVDRLQSSILDIKARYIARKLKKAKRSVSDQPASLIENPELRSQFDMAVQHYLDSGSIPELTKREVRTLLVIDGKSFEIYHRCAAERS